MLTRIRIGTRLYAGFGMLVMLSIAVIGIGWFGLNIAVKGLDGITDKLNPVSVITSKAKYGILESKLAQNGHAVSKFAERMAGGDLSQAPLVTQGNHELAHMTEVLGHMQKSLVGVIGQVREIIGEMAVAATEQADGVAQITAAIAHLNQMTQQNAALVEQGAATASSMSDQTTQLTSVVNTFQLESGTGGKTLLLQ